MASDPIVELVRVSDILERMCRQFARQTRRDGVLVYVHDGDQLMAEAFDAVGWSDDHQPVAREGDAA